jgi:hypothetical protein
VQPAHLAKSLHNDLQSRPHLITVGTQAQRSAALLTESEVSRSWNKLFKNGNFTDETIERAGALLDELRGESPLRHRLQMELAELQKRRPVKIQA